MDVILLIGGFILLVIGFIIDEGLFLFFGALFIAIGAFIPLPDTDDDHVITVQQIEYIVNKCSSFGGLKEIRNDDIICMDKTKIKNEFNPEQKVEAE